MHNLIARIKVILTSAPTLINGLVLLVTAASPQIAELFPQDQETVSKWTIRVLAVLAGTLEIIRRLTPVPKEERGILSYQGQHFAKD